MSEDYDIDAQSNYEGLKYCPRCAGTLVVSEVRGSRRLRCPDCSYILYMGPAAVACVLAERDGQILFVLRKYDPGKGKWCLPAGFMEAGEQPDEAPEPQKEQQAHAVAGDGKVDLKDVHQCFLGSPSSRAGSATVKVAPCPG